LAGDGFEAAGVAEHGLKHDRGDLAAVFVDLSTEMRGVVPTHHDELVEHFGNYPFARMKARGRLVVPPRCRRIRKTDQPFIGPTMVVALEFQD
jgi:hypothetical protein